MKKLLLLIVFGFIIGSCSVDNNTTETVDQNLTAQIAEENSIYGNYKGVFTTLNSDFRATVDINILKPDNSSLVSTLPMATLYLSNGDIVVAHSIQPSSVTGVKNMVFTAENLIFSFSVNSDGTNPIISNVSYKNLEGSILIAKNTLRAPVTPISGTYVCTVCSGPVGNNGEQTFNLLFVGDPTGNTNITSQITLEGNTYNGLGVQNSCNISGTASICTLASGDGTTGSPAFTTLGGRSVYFDGFHNYNNQTSNNAVDCSGIFGNWSFEAAAGTVSGTFESDNQCPLFTENFDNFTGNGFTPNPVSGQLDSNLYAITGFSDGNLSFGGSATGGDFARGTSAAGVTAGGIYSFEVATGNYAIGVQPGGSDFTPGTITIKVTNNSPSTFTSVRVMATTYVNNNEGRSSSIGFAYSLDNSTFIDLIDTFNTPVGASGNAFIFVGTINTPIDLSSTPLAPGSTIYIQLNSDDVAGSGSRDEFAIDDIKVTGM